MEETGPADFLDDIRWRTGFLPRRDSHQEDTLSLPLSPSFFQSFAHFLMLPIETETILNPGIRQRQSILLWQMFNVAEYEGQGSHRYQRSGPDYGPCGAVGHRRVESSGFRRKTEVSTPILFNPAAEAAVSLLGGAADREETFERARSLMDACELQSPQQKRAHHYFPLCIDRFIVALFIVITAFEKAFNRCVLSSNILAF